MNNLQKEIKKAVGETTPHKHNVWQKLQSPKKKNKALVPLFVSIALMAITCIWIFTLEPSTENEQASPDRENGELAFTKLQYEINWPAYLKSTPTILHATNEETLEQYTSLLKVQLQEAVDFKKNHVLFALYSSDGCGLVVDRITHAEKIATVHLALPEELRDSNVLNCTSIEQWHVDIMLIDKQPVENAQFLFGNKPIETTFNLIDVEPIAYEFELLHNPDSIESIIIKHRLTSNAINITSITLLNELAQLINNVTPILGIVNVSDPHYELSIEAHDGQFQTIYLWVSPENERISIMSTRNTHQLYTIPKEKVGYLLDSIAGDWDEIQ